MISYIKALLLRPNIRQFMRFVGIGFLNTAVDFAVLNFLATLFNIYIGFQVGVLNTISFSTAVLHSYWWNKYWAFGRQNERTSLTREISQFLFAGILGGGVILATLRGAWQESGPGIYLIILGALIVGEWILWKAFRLHKDPASQSSYRQFLVFIIITAIGAAINSGIVGVFTRWIPPALGLNQNAWTNFAKIIATLVSLAWNFAGYKIIVFKK